jgi:hypothetical protein
MNDHEVAAAFERLPELVNADAALVRRGRWCSTVFLLGAGALPPYVTVAAGRIAEVARGPGRMPQFAKIIYIRQEAMTVYKLKQFNNGINT